MSTIEINRVEDLREGDFVTLRWEKSEGATVTLEGPMRSWAVRSAITDERFVSATREVPEWEPGTVYEITTHGGDTMRAWCWQLGKNTQWVDKTGIPWADDELTSIKPLPDDAETLRRDVVKYKEAARKYQREHDKECAEVERLRASMDANTHFLISQGGTVWHHDQNCPHRRATPTRKQIVDAMWPDAPEGARVGLMDLDMIDRVVALFEQDGAS